MEELSHIHLSSSLVFLFSVLNLYKRIKLSNHYSKNHHSICYSLSDCRSKMSKRGSYNTKHPTDVHLAVTVYKIITPFWNTESKSLSLGVSIGDHLSKEGALRCTNPQCKQQKGMLPKGGQGSWEKP